MADYVAPDNRAADTDLALLIVAFPLYALLLAVLIVGGALADWWRARG